MCCLVSVRLAGEIRSPVRPRPTGAAVGVRCTRGVQGFRLPSTHRNAALIPQLGVSHDSSWSDGAIYEPEPGGTCSWLPYFIDDVVELPITLPQDHTLFRVRGEETDR